MGEDCGNRLKGKRKKAAKRRSPLTPRRLPRGRCLQRLLVSGSLFLVNRESLFMSSDSVSCRGSVNVGVQSDGCFRLNHRPRAGLGWFAA